MTKSKKGSNFEREICKKLSLWVTSGKRDDVFWRTAGSGGRATIRAKTGKSTVNSEGDIGYLDEIGKPWIRNNHWELKRGYSEMGVLAMIDHSKKKTAPHLIAWMNKAHESCMSSMQQNIIIVFKRDRKDICVCIQLDLYNKLMRRNDILGIERIVLDVWDHTLVIFRFEQLLGLDPKSLINIRRRIC